ncbi:efflux RND transporter periplasmic adaptor subunit [Halopseudomonas phragmitis]|uniref:Uncharacterized protein n=1 Tax=Halopseudomonas phragmitis TaxID=1931241 RepID=A0A1V0B7D5_9GAMM|nr:efflux RND transporter periplasmic adaptor subunit [Halopseudomonas phragmitis]AQZ95704.1 hypothetical protein BVH74_13510 [Halopseudomonas phragmitis]
MRIFVPVMGLVLLAGCGSDAAAPPTQQVVKVRAVEVQAGAERHWTLNGTVQARHQASLAFRLPGEISERLVQAGERVEAGDVLLRLDPRDIRQQLNAAQAALSAARAQADNAEANRRRLETLREQHLVPLQVYEDAAASARAAREAMRSAEAALEQARSARDYAELRAPASGILVEVSGQVGQVVAAGQSVAQLAYDGLREVEAFIPELRRRSIPQQGRVELFGNGQQANVTLREMAGSADPQTRSWRARFVIEQQASDWPLGSSVTLHLNGQTGTDSELLLSLPLGALIDRGQGLGVWVIEEGRVHRQPVELVRTDTEQAYVRSALAAGAQVVALGAHLLEDGQRVEVLP